MKNQLLEAHGHLGAVITQSIDSDDQIIMGHVRDAHGILTELIRGEQQAQPTRKQLLTHVEALEKRVAELIVERDRYDARRRALYVRLQRMGGER